MKSTYSTALGSCGLNGATVSQSAAPLSEVPAQTCPSGNGEWRRAPPATGRTWLPCDNYTTPEQPCLQLSLLRTGLEVRQLLFHVLCVCHQFADELHPCLHV